MFAKIVKLATSRPWLYDFVQFVLEGDYHQDIIGTVAGRVDEKLLEVGCGTGYFSKFFDCSYTGVDLDEFYLQSARQKFGSRRKNFLAMDACRLDFSDKSFDKVVFINTIHHLSDDQVLKSLSEAKRVAKKSVFIFDMATTRNNIITPLLLSLDNGKYVRSLEEQVSLIKTAMPVADYFTFSAPRQLLTHTAIVCPAL